MSVGRGARGVLLLVHFSSDKRRKVTRPLCGRNALLVIQQLRITCPRFDGLTTDNSRRSLANQKLQRIPQHLPRHRLPQEPIHPRRARIRFRARIGARGDCQQR